MESVRSKMMVVTMFLGLVLTAPVQATTYFVDDDAAASGDGLSWTTAFRFLQDALTAAGDGDLIKVAQGTYHPDDKEGAIDSRDRMLSFELKSGLISFIVKGGYAGLGSPDPDLRDPALFVATILSGDLANDDSPSMIELSTRADNSFSVVNGGTGTDDLTILDGFTIRGGHGGFSNLGGAGMFMPTGSSPTIRNCTFTLNWLPGGDFASGGGLLLERDSMSLIEDCVFIDNEAAEGGGMTSRNFSNPDIRRCRFENNTALNRGGGGVLLKLQGRARFTDCAFIDNTLPALGGTPRGGAGLLLCDDADARLRGCLFDGNVNADRLGGAAYTDASSRLTVVDCVFINNETGSVASTARGRGGAVYLQTEFSNILGGAITSRFINCVFKDNNAVDTIGAAAQGGAVYISNPAANSEWTNCLFVGNTARQGGAMYSFRADPTIVNCTFTENDAVGPNSPNGGGIYLITPFNTEVPALTNCILWNNSDPGGTDLTAQIFLESGFQPNVTYSCIQGDDPGTGGIPFCAPFCGGTNNGNINANPRFIEPAAGNYRLQNASPCVDAANSDAAPPDDQDVDGDADPAEFTPDLDKLERIVDLPRLDTGTGANMLTFLDMGAFETQVPTRFVDAAAPAGGDGKSWQTAYMFLQDALLEAAGNSAIPEIRVAGGLYNPDEDEGGNVPQNDRSASFQLLSGLPLLGGYRGAFDGSGASPDDRNISTFETTLSGDLANNDVASVLELSSGPSRVENSYHVVIGNGTDATAILDGFTISGGNADDSPSSPDGWGGGMLNYDANVTSSPTILNCTFTDNRAFIGGGMMNQNGNPRVINCKFLANAAVDFAGGLCNDRLGAQEIVNCLFKDNLSEAGGAIVNVTGSATLINCTISGNTATGTAGGILNLGSATVTITNCIVWGNLADQGTVESAQIDIGSQSVTMNVTYSCIQDNDPGADVPFCDPNCGGTDNFNIDFDPMFADADLRVLLGSPCIDVGDDTAVPPDSNDVDGDGDVLEPTPDLDDRNRILDGDGIGSAVVDMGAYEFDCQCPGVVSSDSIKFHANYSGPGVWPRGIASGHSECRVINNTTTLEFVFNEAVYSDDGDNFVAGDFAIQNGSVNTVTFSFDRKTLTLQCNGVADGQSLDISFVVQDVYANSVGLQFDWLILLGDANDDGVVDAADQNVVIAEDTNTTTSTNFRCDLDKNGLIEADVQGARLDLDLVTW